MKGTVQKGTPNNRLQRDRGPVTVLLKLNDHGWAARGARMVWTPPGQVSVRIGNS